MSEEGKGKITQAIAALFAGARQARDGVEVKLREGGESPVAVCPQATPNEAEFDYAAYVRMASPDSTSVEGAVGSLYGAAQGPEETDEEYRQRVVGAMVTPSEAEVLRDLDAGTRAAGSVYSVFGSETGRLPQAHRDRDAIRRGLEASDPDRVTSSLDDDALRDGQRYLHREYQVDMARLIADQGTVARKSEPAGWLYRDRERDAMEWAALAHREGSESDSN